jgi:predicted CoA-binding protein
LKSILFEAPPDRHPANVIFNKINLRYPVDVFPMNPRGGDLFGQKVYTGIQAIPHSIDLNPVVCSAEKCVVADARIMLPEVKESTNI